jgi:Fic family protein
MGSFVRISTLDPVPGDIVTLLRRIDQVAGSEARYTDQLPHLLGALQIEARIESVTASSAIEGVHVAAGRVAHLLSGVPTRIRNRSEAEFAGYSAALDALYHDNPGELTVGLVLHLHRLLYSFNDGRGGSFKREDNPVIDQHPDGRTSTRFTPVTWRETPFFVEELVCRTNAALRAGDVHPLLITAAFALDLLCIHPFADGNGRVARLATAHLLQRSGYGVGRYVSIEQLIYETRDDYDESLAASTVGWFDGSHSVWPWSRYLLGRLVAASTRFEARVATGTGSGNKQRRVRDFVLLHAPESFTIGDARRALPGVSDNTIRLVLTELRNEGLIASDGSGRSARWQRTAGRR